MDLSQKTTFCLTTLFFGNFVLAEEPLIKSWFDVPITQMLIFILFVDAGILFDGTFSLWKSSAKLWTSVSLMKNIRSFKKRLNKIGPNIDPCGAPLGISRYELKFNLFYPLKTVCKVVSN